MLMSRIEVIDQLRGRTSKKRLDHMLTKSTAALRAYLAYVYSSDAQKKDQPYQWPQPKKEARCEFPGHCGVHIDVAKEYLEKMAAVFGDPLLHSKPRYVAPRFVSIKKIGPGIKVHVCDGMTLDERFEYERATGEFPISESSYQQFVAMDEAEVQRKRRQFGIFLLVGSWVGLLALAALVALHWG